MKPSKLFARRSALVMPPPLTIGRVGFVSSKEHGHRSCPTAPRCPDRHAASGEPIPVALVAKARGSPPGVKNSRRAAPPGSPPKPLVSVGCLVVAVWGGGVGAA